MQRREVVSHRHVKAPIEAVWHLVATAETYKDWGTMSVSFLEREGVPAPDGVGAIRRFGFRIYQSREEVVAFDAPHHLAYVLHSGLPVRDYRADVTLREAADGGTDLEWRSSFTPPWPGSGWFWSAFLQQMVDGFTRGIAKAVQA